MALNLAAIGLSRCDLWARSTVYVNTEPDESDRYRCHELQSLEEADPVARVLMLGANPAREVKLIQH